ncbi:GM18762, partial [Drosophila sechellia]
IEDEGNHGNDETRLFILSSLAQSQMSRVACILCEEPLLVFDRYPLVDGSFFLSPKQHSSGCIEVSNDPPSTLYTVPHARIIMIYFALTLGVDQEKKMSSVPAAFLSVQPSFMKRQMWRGNLLHTHDHAAFTRPRAPENFQLQLAGELLHRPPLPFAHFSGDRGLQTDPAIYDPFKSA